MQYERYAARELGLDWDVELWAGDSVDGFEFINVYPESLRSRISRRYHFFKILKSASRSYDVVLLRYMPGDLFLPFFISDKARVCFVHHSKEDVALRSMFPGAKGFLFSLLERFLGVLSLRKANGFIGVTQELVRYEFSRAFCSSKKSFVYPNGIDYARFDLVGDGRGGKIKVAFVASRFFSWHGLSLILEDLSHFSRRGDVELHLVGEVLQGDLQLIEELALKSNVIVHGKLSVSELRDVLSTADVGLASFGLGQAGIAEACTLKVREYLAAGIPVYSGHVDVGVPDSFEFYSVGGPNFSEIYSYATDMRRFSRQDVRNSARSFIDKKYLVKDLYAWLVLNFKG
ncbi:glycosyltransferase [Pseudomonas sp. WN033]|nr:glycosyltransferase [Pseudomonas sp. WN033]